MSDNVGSPNQNPQDQPLPPTTMAETQQSPPESQISDTATAAASAAERLSNISFSIWPPSERTREAVRNRLIETLSSPSILSKRYGTLSREEAVDAAQVIENDAFEVAGKAATPDDDGIEILQVYSKEISKRMLERVKARSGESASAPETTAPVNEASNKPEGEGEGEEDSGSTALPPSEKTESVAGEE